MKTFVAFILTLTLAACGPKSPAKSTFEVTGTPAERIARVSKIIAAHAPLPSPLVEAYFVEEQAGNGVLGPSDFSAFYALSVTPSAVAAWRAALSPLEQQNTPAAYIAPKQLPAWWPTAAEFGTLEFHSPKLVTGRSNGWVGIQAQTGKIFIHTFTQ